MEDKYEQSIAVLGAGVVGLSTAINVQNLYPSSKVTIIAEKFNKDTTSDGAAGLFRPSSAKTSGDMQIVRKWCEDSFKWYSNIWSTDEGPEAGIHRLGGYVYGNNPCHQQAPLYSFSTRIMSSDELGSLPGNPKYGYYTDTLMVECRRYLPWLLKRLYKNGGKVKVMKIESLSQITGQYDVYINCLGLSSRDLFNDHEMFPVRGHLIRVYAPWVKNLYFKDPSTYIYPGQDNVVLGGTRQKGEESPVYSDKDFTDVFQRCCEILPALKNAPVLSRWVGIRPHRTSVRCEKEILYVDGNIMKVVHNVGHGGDGVALSWGSAIMAARLVGEMLIPRSSTTVKSSL